MKTYRGAALGKIWLFAKPAVYILVFWVALKFGLRSSSDVNGKPFLLWLAAGVFPWFFMSDMITTGSDVYRRYPYLVNRIKFPLSLISTFYTLSLLIIFACMMAFTIVVALLTGVHLGRYMLQLPLVMVFMFLFWVAWSMALFAFERDIARFLEPAQEARHPVLLAVRHPVRHQRLAAHRPSGGVLQPGHMGRAVGA